MTEIELGLVLARKHQKKDPESGSYLEATASVVAAEAFGAVKTDATRYEYRLLLAKDKREMEESEVRRLQQEERTGIKEERLVPSVELVRQEALMTKERQAMEEDRQRGAKEKEVLEAAVADTVAAALKKQAKDNKRKIEQVRMATHAMAGETALPKAEMEKRPAVDAVFTRPNYKEYDFIAEISELSASERPLRQPVSGTISIP